MPLRPQAPSVLDQVLKPTTPAIKPRTQSGAVVPTVSPEALPGVLPTHNPHTGEPNPLMDTMKLPPPPSPFTPAATAAAATFATDAPAPTEPRITFSITPTLGAVEHSGAILDHLREHVHQLGLTAKVTFHF